MNISKLDEFMTLVDDEKEVVVTITIFVTETVPCINTLMYKMNFFFVNVVYNFFSIIISFASSKLT